jgi:hypothetical protein
MRTPAIVMLVAALLFVPSIPAPLPAEPGGQSAGPEQTVFAIEGTTEKKHKNWVDHPPIEHPVTIPESVVSLLRADKLVASCLKTENVAEAPATWFQAAAIHLHKGDQVDFVVLPNNECLYGAMSDPFWIFGQSGNGYGLLLRSDLLGIAVLNSKTNEYRDIRATFIVSGARTSVKFKFDGQKYLPS